MLLLHLVVHLSHSVPIVFACTVGSLFHFTRQRKVTPYLGQFCHLTHWGRVTHICVSELTIIGSDNGLSPGRQAVIWTDDRILLVGPLETNLIEILIEIHTFHSWKRIWKRRPCLLGLNVSNYPIYIRNTAVSCIGRACVQDVVFPFSYLSKVLKGLRSGFFAASRCISENVSKGLS